MPQLLPLQETVEEGRLLGWRCRWKRRRLSSSFSEILSDQISLWITILFSMMFGQWKHQLTISCGYLFLQLTILVRDALRGKLHSEDAYLAQVLVCKANNAGLTPSTTWGSEDHRTTVSPSLPNPDSYVSRGFIIIPKWLQLVNSRPLIHWQNQ